MEIEYRCPTHGVVHLAPSIDGEELPLTCPMTIRRKVGDEVEVSTCGLPAERHPRVGVNPGSVPRSPVTTHEVCDEQGLSDGETHGP